MVLNLGEPVHPVQHLHAIEAVSDSSYHHWCCDGTISYHHVWAFLRKYSGHVEVNIGSGLGHTQ